MQESVIYCNVQYKIWGDDPVKGMMKYLKGYGKESVIAPLFKMLEALLDMLVPRVRGGKIDKGKYRGDAANKWQR